MKLKKNISVWVVGGVLVCAFLAPALFAQIVASVIIFAVVFGVAKAMIPR